MECKFCSVKLTSYTLIEYDTEFGTIDVCPDCFDTKLG